MSELDNEQASVYDQNYSFLKWKERMYKSPWFLPMMRIRTKYEVQKPLDLKPGQQVLDVGCNIGDLGHILKSSGITTFGVDLNSHALQKGYQSYGNIHATQASALALPFEQNQFDTVISQDLLEHLNSEAEATIAIQEMDRVNKGQRMLHKITVNEDIQWINSDKTHFLKKPARWWSEKFESEGWKVISPTTKGFFSVSRRGVWFKMHGYYLLERKIR